MSDSTTPAFGAPNQSLNSAFDGRSNASVSDLVKILPKLWKSSSEQGVNIPRMFLVKEMRLQVSRKCICERQAPGQPRRCGMTYCVHPVSSSRAVCKGQPSNRVEGEFSEDPIFRKPFDPLLRDLLLQSLDRASCGRHLTGNPEKEHQSLVLGVLKTAYSLIVRNFSCSFARFGGGNGRLVGDASKSKRHITEEERGENCNCSYENSPGIPPDHATLDTKLGALTDSIKPSHCPFPLWTSRHFAMPFRSAAFAHG